MNGPSDSIIVKVILRTDDKDNDASIQKDWRRLLAVWARANNCEITKIEWTRLRTRFVSDPKKPTDDVYCDVIEERR